MRLYNVGEIDPSSSGIGSEKKLPFFDSVFYLVLRERLLKHYDPPTPLNNE
jgi:hypothetical protein